jgi:cold shock CspA family protein
MQGKVTRIFHKQGFGYIRTAEGQDVFFHRSNLQQLDFDHLRKGDTVELSMVRSQNGLRAVRVHHVKPQEDLTSDESVS